MCQEDLIRRLRARRDWARFGRYPMEWPPQAATIKGLSQKSGVVGEADFPVAPDSSRGLAMPRESVTVSTALRELFLASTRCQRTVLNKVKPPKADRGYPPAPGFNRGFRWTKGNWEPFQRFLAYS